MNGTGGTLILSGTNGYTGGTNAAAGTLVVTTSTAIADGSSLIIGAGGTFVFDPSVHATSTVVVAASPASTTVPTAKSAAILSAATTTTALPPSGWWTICRVGPASADHVLMVHERRPTTVESRPTSSVTTALPASFIGPQLKNRSIPALASPSQSRALTRLLAASVAPPMAVDLVCLGPATNRADNSDQHRQRDAAIRALQAVFAAY